MSALRIVSNDDSPFEDRREAGALLARELLALKGLSPLVLGIPRGGLVVAGEVARALGGDLDALFALKIPFPGNPELALGAVAEGGEISLDRRYVERAGLTGYAEEERRKASAELSRRAENIRRMRPRIPLAGRTVVVVDDGVATGATTRAALRAAAGEAPRTLVAAFPVGLRGAVEKLSEEADETVCLRCPPDFLAVSQFYRRFRQVGDEEIAALFR